MMKGIRNGNLKTFQFLPKAWELRIAKDKKEQFDVLKELLNRKDLEYVVNACDAGREGETNF